MRFKRQPSCRSGHPIRQSQVFIPSLELNFFPNFFYSITEKQIESNLLTIYKPIYNLILTFNKQLVNLGLTILIVKKNLLPNLPNTVIT